MSEGAWEVSYWEDKEGKKREARRRREEGRRKVLSNCPPDNVTMDSPFSSGLGIIGEDMARGILLHTHSPPLDWRRTATFQDRQRPLHWIQHCAGKKTEQCVSWVGWLWKAFIYFLSSPADSLHFPLFLPHHHSPTPTPSQSFKYIYK